MAERPMEQALRERPQIIGKFRELVAAQNSTGGLDPKTRELVIIGIMTAHRNTRAVKAHVITARNKGATRDEVIGAVMMNLHLSGLSTITECLPVALEALDKPASDSAGAE